MKLDYNRDNTHYLKTWPEYYERVVSKKKTVEIRKNDRDFRVGDILILQEYYPETKQYTGRQAGFGVTDIVENASMFGLMDGYVAMSIRVWPGIIE
jgi:ribosomal protein S17